MIKILGVQRFDKTLHCATHEWNARRAGMSTGLHAFACRPDEVAQVNHHVNHSPAKHPHTPSIVRTIRIAYMYGAKLYHTYGVLTAGGTHRTIGHTRNRYETDTKAYRPTKPTTKPTQKKPVELSVCSICIFAVHVAAAVCSSSSGRYAVVLWDCPQVQGTSAKPT